MRGDGRNCNTTWPRVPPSPPAAVHSSGRAGVLRALTVSCRGDDARQSPRSARRIGFTRHVRLARKALSRLVPRRAASPRSR